MESQLKRFFVFLAVAVGAALVMAQIKISQYPNTSTLNDTDMFIVASGSTNKQIRWSQLKSLNTNALATNVNFTVNNLTVNSNFTVLGDTYIVNSNLYVTTTNVTINTNTTINAQTIFNGKVIINTNVTYATNAASIWSVATNVPAGTNVIIDFELPCQTVNVPGHLNFLQTTNRSVAGKFKSTIFQVPNFTGSNIVLSINTNAGWFISGGTFPVTCTNGTWNTICFNDWGPQETNVGCGINTWKAQ